MLRRRVRHPQQGSALECILLGLLAATASGLPRTAAASSGSGWQGRRQAPECAAGQQPFRRVSALDANRCFTLCTPRGPCSRLLGFMAALGQVSAGACRGHPGGYGVPGENLYGSDFQGLMDSAPVCRGATSSLWHRHPAPAAAYTPEQMLVNSGVPPAVAANLRRRPQYPRALNQASACAPGRASYMRVSQVDPNRCFTFCIPSSLCTTAAQFAVAAGQFVEGSCQYNGYAVKGAYGYGDEQQKMSTLTGMCHGVDISLWQQHMDAPKKFNAEQLGAVYNVPPGMVRAGKAVLDGASAVAGPLGRAAGALRQFRDALAAPRR